VTASSGSAASDAVEWPSNRSRIKVVTPALDALPDSVMRCHAPMTCRRRYSALLVDANDCSDVCRPPIEPLNTEMETRLRPPSATGAQQGSSLFTHFEDVQVAADNQSINQSITNLYQTNGPYHSKRK